MSGYYVKSSLCSPPPCRCWTNKKKLGQIDSFITRWHAILKQNFKVAHFEIYIYIYVLFFFFKKNPLLVCVVFDTLRQSARAAASCFTTKGATNLMEPWHWQELLCVSPRARAKWVTWSHTYAHTHIMNAQSSSQNNLRRFRIGGRQLRSNDRTLGGCRWFTLTSRSLFPFFKARAPVRKTKSTHTHARTLP